MNVLVIPEDFRKDQYVLKPIVQAILKAAGRPRATVRVCQEPLLGGVTHALNWEKLSEILEMYRGMVQLYLLIVDRDGVAGRRTALDKLEKQAAAVLSSNAWLLAENAWQEVEVWALAGQELPKAWKWNAVKTEPHPKEKYFLPFAKLRGLFNEPGQGRKTLAAESAGQYQRLRSRCSDDIVVLEQRLKAIVAQAK